VYILASNDVRRLPPTCFPTADAAETGEMARVRSTALVGRKAPVRARFVIGKLLERARRLQVPVPSLVLDAYIQHHPPDEEPWFPGDEEDGSGASGESSAGTPPPWSPARTSEATESADTSRRTRRGVAVRGGFQPLLPRQDDGTSGDQIYYQGHARPDVLAAYLEGRITEAQDGQLPSGDGGQRLSSYPHPA